MTENLEQRVDDLLYQADWLPDGVSKLALVEEAVRIADLLGDIDLQYRARYELATTAVLGGIPERGLVAHTWMSAAFDKYPGRFSAEDFMWHYKRTASVLDEFPQISREKIGQVFDDMLRRYTHEGMSLRGYYSRRLHSAHNMGQDWRAYAAQWRSARADGNEDCAACERDTGVNLLLWEDKLDEAIKFAKPLLSGRLSCHSVPHRTLARIMLKLWAAGDHAQALELHRRGYAMIRGEANKLDLIGNHLELLGRAGMHTEGMRMFERHARWLDANTSPWDHMAFWRGARVTLAATRELSRTQSRRMRLPESLECWRKDGTYVLTELLTWVDTKLDGLAAAFDDRNGNDFHTRTLAELRAIVPQEPKPARRSAKKRPAPKKRRHK